MSKVGRKPSKNRILAEQYGVTLRRVYRLGGYERLMAMEPQVRKMLLAEVCASPFSDMRQSKPRSTVGMFPNPVPTFRFRNLCACGRDLQRGQTFCNLCTDARYECAVRSGLKARVCGACGCLSRSDICRRCWSKANSRAEMRACDAAHKEKE